MPSRKAHPLKYHGGKSYLAAWIQSFLPPHLHRVHTHFGGGGEFFEWPHEGVSEVVNDIDGNLTTFWQVLRDPKLFPEFLRRAQATPFSEVEWNAAEVDVLTGNSDPVAAALAFFILCRQSRQGLKRSFATLSKTRVRRGMNEQASSWLTAVEGLPEAHARLKSVVITNVDASEIIAREDSPDTLFYLDPPYLHGTRTLKDAYDFEMTEEQHDELLMQLAEIKGKFILSGRPSDLYNNWCVEMRWKCFTHEIDNKSSAAAVKELKTECLWMNFDPAEHRPSSPKPQRPRRSRGLR